ncbi:MAG: glycosyltransferase family 9 protein [Candidatus Amulumruptor caecigallinarius]|nr:glycosyltransferase family 9 protein [Candidatus Amulumruptor caecigallinarius]MCM1396383.1 glycosyltransferase family 9 protein [Candidatus Amulumruptor caecigallinarius]MCM1453560.1 glycosyltransferase family 9 protein [bacterium]
MARAPRHILAVRFSALGDVAMAIPVIYALAAANPRTRFTVLTKPGPARIFLNPPKNVRVLPIHLPGNPLGDSRALWHAISEASREVKVDMVVDLHDVLRTRLLQGICALRGIPFRRFDKARAAKRALIAHKPGAAPVTPTPARYLAAFPPSLRPPKPFPGLFPKGADPAAFHTLTPPKRPGERWLGIAPFAAHPGKVYPPELMRRVVDDLAWLGSTRIFLFGGGPREEAILRDWAAPHGNVISVAGSGIGFPGELALMSHIDAILTMDSANMHLAALTQTPTLTLWGPTHPNLGFTPQQPTPQPQTAPSDKPAPQTTPQHIHLLLNLPCQPCSAFGNRPCTKGDHPCLSKITPQQIQTALLSLLPPAARSKTISL